MNGFFDVTLQFQVFLKEEENVDRKVFFSHVSIVHTSTTYAKIWPQGNV